MRASLRGARPRWQFVCVRHPRADGGRAPPSPRRGSRGAEPPSRLERSPMPRRDQPVERMTSATQRVHLPRCDDVPFSPNVLQCVHPPPAVRARTPCTATTHGSSQPVHENSDPLRSLAKAAMRRDEPVCTCPACALVLPCACGCLPVPLLPPAVAFEKLYCPALALRLPGSEDAASSTCRCVPCTCHSNTTPARAQPPECPLVTVALGVTEPSTQCAQ